MAMSSKAETKKLHIRSCMLYPIVALNFQMIARHFSFFQSMLALLNTNRGDTAPSIMLLFFVVEHKFYTIRVLLSFLENNIFV